MRSILALYAGTKLSYRLCGGQGDVTLTQRYFMSTWICCMKLVSVNVNSETIYIVCDLKLKEVMILEISAMFISQTRVMLNEYILSH